MRFGEPVTEFIIINQSSNEGVNHFVHVKNHAPPVDTQIPKTGRLEKVATFDSSQEKGESQKKENTLQSKKEN